jgi:hypothetical protein
MGYHNSPAAKGSKNPHYCAVELHELVSGEGFKYVGGSYVYFLF